MVKSIKLDARREVSLVMNAICKRCGWVMANPDWGCLDCAWQEYNNLKEKIGENK